MHEPERDVEPPLHAAGVAARDAVGGVAQADELEQLVDALAQRRAGHAVDAPLEQEVLAAGRLPVDARVLRDVADRALRTRFGWRTTSSPATSARPESGCVSVASVRTVVDLPAPFGPSRPNTSPSRTANETPSSACTVL